MPRKKDIEVVRAIGIDTGKNTLHMVGLDEKGAIVLREKVSRGRIAARLGNVPPCLIGIEAGMATHYMSRELVALGHRVKQVPPAYSKPFRQGQNDFRDAQAVAEAVQRPSTRCVPIKTDDQMDLQALHRVRSRLIGDRTAVINQLRGFLLEHGIPVRQGPRFLRQQLPQILATRADVLSRRMVRILGDIVDDWDYLDERIKGVTDEIEGLARSDASCGQLMTVPGIGPIIASATIAAIGNGTLAVSRSVEIAISERSSYKAPAPSCFTRRAGRSIALDPGSRRLHRNVLVIALANKLARIALTVLVQGRSYETRVEPAAA